MGVAALAKVKVEMEVLSGQRRIYSVKKGAGVADLDAEYQRLNEKENYLHSNWEWFCKTQGRKDLREEAIGLRLLQN